MGPTQIIESTMNHTEEWQRSATAHHEAGHVVIRYLLHFEPRSVRIAAKSTAQCAAHLHGIKLETDGSDRARLRLEKAIRICFAGWLAEKKFSNDHWDVSHGEYDNAKIEELCLRACGSSNQAGAFKRWLEIATQEMVDDHWSAIERVAKRLLVHDRLAGAHISIVARGAYSAGK
jgi:hypothetical protein